mgnify:CR=1 FL=1|jgi:hypothetical protein
MVKNHKQSGNKSPFKEIAEVYRKREEEYQKQPPAVKLFGKTTSSVIGSIIILGVLFFIIYSFLFPQDNYPYTKEEFERLPGYIQERPYSDCVADPVYGGYDCY